MMCPTHGFILLLFFMQDEQMAGQYWWDKPPSLCFWKTSRFSFFGIEVVPSNLLSRWDDLEEVSEYYQHRGCFNELISLMESGLTLGCAHMGIFTEFGVLDARYRYEKLMEHIKLFSTHLNIPKLIRACNEQQH
ncbi:hypothetical protein Vadar_024614 [Vaccinium darrowii]|uniref:Uncharacterized protein n=1 Tax=Vaccinium darrowii TaxID=229202 RepID=A0ACB7YQL0_9ERIC|nr:hypothetical protein Vadar_024614 [Vaccinium darrowii]